LEKIEAVREGAPYSRRPHPAIQKLVLGWMTVVEKVPLQVGMKGTTI